MIAEPKNPPTKAKEAAEPKADRATVPVLLVGLFALLFFWGLVYLNNYAGGFHAQVYRPFPSIADLQARNELTHPKDPDLILGKIVFGKSCVACHQADGKGSAAVGAPPLAGSDWVNATGPNRIICIALHGLTGPVTVIGAQYGTGTMPPFKDAFTDKEIAAALTYVRQEWGNKAGKVKPEEVTAVRKATADRPGPWTAAELQQVPEK